MLAFDIADIILSHSVDIFSLAILILLILALLIGLFEYRNLLFARITNRRNKWHFVALCLFGAGLVLFYRTNKILDGWMVITAILWGVYFVASFLSLRALDFNKWHDPVLRRYARYLADGTYGNRLDFFEQKHWYQKLHFRFLDADAKIEYFYLYSTYLSSCGRHADAYETLSKIKSELLYPEEQAAVNTRKAILLTWMGGMTDALQIMGPPEENKTEDPLVWLAYSFIFEQSADLDQAFSYAQKAVGFLSKNHLSKRQTAQVLNDYARYAFLIGNTDEALRCYHLAWNAVVDTHDVRLVHVVGGNRVIRMAYSGRPEAECQGAIRDYECMIQAESLENQVELLNTKLAYYRQIGDSAKEYELICRGYQSMSPGLSGSKAELLRSSMFQMLMNGHFIHDWFDPEISTDINAYLSLPLMERIAVFHAYMGILEQEEFRVLRFHEPYSSLYAMILDYYKTDALRELDAKINQIPVYQAHKYRAAVKEKLFILKQIEGTQHIDNSKEIYLQLYNSLSRAGLKIDAADVLMLLIDECSSPYNIEVLPPYTNDWIYYSEYLNQLPQPPEPRAVDEIHLKYTGNCHRLKARPLKRDIIEEHIDTLISEVDHWQNHPDKLTMSIHISHILMCLGRESDAKRFFLYYKKSGASKSHFSSWMQNEIDALEARFSRSV